MSPESAVPAPPPATARHRVARPAAPAPYVATHRAGAPSGYVATHRAALPAPAPRPDRRERRDRPAARRLFARPSARRGIASIVGLALAASTVLTVAITNSPSAAGAAPVSGTNPVVLTMAAGTTIQPGKNIIATNRQYALTMRTDGNLVLTAQRQVLWQSSTSVANSYAIMQSNGNLVVRAPTYAAQWATHTSMYAGASFQVTADGNMSIARSGTVYWQSNTVNSTLTVGHTLLPGFELAGASGKYRLILQTDGNLVLYGPGALWYTGTNGNPDAQLVMQSDGNLVLYSSGPSGAHMPLWNSKTAGTTVSQLINNDDGTVSLTTASGIPISQMPVPKVTSGAQGRAIVAAATSQTGRMYCYDGGDQNGPTHGNDSACTKIVGFDCSGLALYAVYRATHILLPHYSGDQFTKSAQWGGRKIARNALLPGDLVFFVGDGGTTSVPGHVGIYVGNNQMIDAQQSGVPVGVHTLYNGYIGAVRYWS